MGLSDLPEFIPLDEAAERHQLDPQVLHQALADDTVRTVKVGESILVDAEDVAVIAAQVVDLCEDNSELVSLGEAARRLNLNTRTVSRWQEHGWLPVHKVGPGRSKLVSWARAQALGKLYEDQGRPGSRLIPRGQDFAQRLIA
ncbi:MAG: hypothetical protein BWY63_02435 [Chloroflexi bacterium ADurb.Bin360]|nr:MAG: hypothetical protein BWY63_02435 [Chloroflexi bacterium ADurb.Bin360]